MVLICDGSHRLVDYSWYKTSLQVNVSNLKEVVIDITPVLISPGRVQHTAAGWNRDRALQYHIFFVPGVSDHKDTVASAYGYRLQPKAEHGQSIDDREDSLPELLPDVEAARKGEVLEEMNKDSDGDIADSLCGD